MRGRHSPLWAGGALCGQLGSAPGLCCLQRRAGLGHAPPPPGGEADGGDTQLGCPGLAGAHSPLCSQNNELLRDVFGLGPVLVLDAATLKACKIARCEKVCTPGRLCLPCLPEAWRPRGVLGLLPSSPARRSLPHSSTCTMLLPPRPGPRLVAVCGTSGQTSCEAGLQKGDAHTLPIFLTEDSATTGSCQELSLYFFNDKAKSRHRVGNWRPGPLGSWSLAPTRHPVASSWPVSGWASCVPVPGLWGGSRRVSLPLSSFAPLG